MTFFATSLWMIVTAKTTQLQVMMACTPPQNHVLLQSAEPVPGRSKVEAPMCKVWKTIIIIIAGVSMVSLGGFFHRSKTRATWVEEFHNELIGRVFDLDSPYDENKCGKRFCKKSLKIHQASCNLSPEELATKFCCVCGRLIPSRVCLSTCLAFIKFSSPMSATFVGKLSWSSYSSPSTSLLLIGWRSMPVTPVAKTTQRGTPSVYTCKSTQASSDIPVNSVGNNVSDTQCCMTTKWWCTVWGQRCCHGSTTSLHWGAADAEHRA